MKKPSVLILALAACCGAVFAANVPHDGQRGTATFDKGGMKISVEYGSPDLKGRDLEALIKPGIEWRMGSDAATTLTTETDLKFGPAAIPKGKYTLKAKIVAAQDWRLLFQTEDKKTVGEAPLKFEKVARSSDHMKIVLDGTAGGGTFTLLWGNLSLSTGFSKQ
jgi:hypothetical protein